MRTISRALLVCAVFLLPLSASAKEKKAKKEKGGKGITVTGVLGEKPADAGENVLAQLSDIKAGKKAKNAPTGTVSLVSSDEAVAQQIKDLAAKQAKVSVTGTVDGSTMTVTAIKAQAGKAGKGGGGEKKKKGKKKNKEEEQ